jgi:hypothetical protein
MPGEDHNRPSQSPDVGSADAPRRFFLVVRAKRGGDRIYRAYPQDNAVLFVYVANLAPFVDVEIARRDKQRPWYRMIGETIGKGAAILVVCALGMGPILLQLALAAAQINLGKTIDMILMLVTFGGWMVLALVAAGVLNALDIARRAAALEDLSEGQLRQKAARDRWSLRVTAEALSDVRIDPIDKPWLAGSTDKPTAQLSFHHAPTGNWQFVLASAQDASDATSAFQRLLGRKGVAVHVPLGKD